MSDMILKARVRKRDKDIRQAVEYLELEEGEMADLIRDGFRMMLAKRGILGAKVKFSGTITPDSARLVARELMKNIGR